jgi:hypothetical protein
MQPPYIPPTKEEIIAAIALILALIAVPFVIGLIVLMVKSVF